MNPLKQILIGLLLSGMLFQSCKDSQTNGQEQEAQPVNHEVQLTDSGIESTDGIPLVTPASFREKDLESLPNLKKIRLPKGFRIELFATGVKQARSLARGSKGTIFVGTRNEGNVYALPDRDGDNQADEVILLAKGMNMPCGVAIKGEDLYVAEVDRIWKYKNIEAALPNIPKKELVSKAFPSDKHHGWKNIAFGPDEKLYIPVGAPCNICNHPEDPRYASIMRMNPDGTELEVYAHGIRNSVGFDWNPKDGSLWLTDNGRDWLGDNSPPDELNRADKKDMHFGYPFCHGGDIPDPEYGDKGCSGYTPPAQRLGPHVAALGMIFIGEKMFPKSWHNDILICEHGSWNRESKIGYRITHIKVEGAESKGYAVFADGWLQGEDAWGRPADIHPLPDGSLLVSDDRANVIYRIRYQ